MAQTSKNQKGKKKICLKSVLCTPYNIKWPNTCEKTQQKILCDLKVILSKYNLKKPFVQKNLKKHQRKQEIEKLWDGKSEEEKNLKMQLVYGVNEVTKNLEKDNLCLVLVDDDAFVLCKHLIQLSAVRQCNAVLLKQLTSTLIPLLGISQLSCIGFRKLSPGDCDAFKGLFEFVRSSCQQVELPWLEFEKSLAQYTETMHSENRNKESESRNKESESKDDECEGQEIAKIKSSSEKDSKCSESGTFSDFSETIFENVMKRKFEDLAHEGNVPQTEKSNYKNVSLHKMQANPDKKKKKKMKK